MVVFGPLSCDESGRREHILLSIYYIRGAIQNYVDFFYNFRTDNRQLMKFAIHII